MADTKKRTHKQLALLLPYDSFWEKDPGIKSSCMPWRIHTTNRLRPGTVSSCEIEEKNSATTCPGVLRRRVILFLNWKMVGRGCAGCDHRLERHKRRTSRHQHHQNWPDGTVDISALRQGPGPSGRSRRRRSEIDTGLVKYLTIDFLHQQASRGCQAMDP